MSSFREKLIAASEHTRQPVAASGASKAYRELKSRVHLQVVEQVDLVALQTLAPELVRQELATIVEMLLRDEPAALNEVERRSLIRDLHNEMFGFGPLELLMADPAVSDILVNRFDRIYVERNGKLERTDVSFTDEPHLLRIIDKIVSRIGRRIDEACPMVDARLPDGSRVNAVIPPIALDGATLSIRRFAQVPLQMADLVQRLESLTPDMAFLLESLCKAKVNMLISGGTGAGKTTLLNILSGYIPPTERIVTIEDAAELQLQQPHVVRLETRPMNIEGKGEITQRALLQNALRMRPDRIIIGEVRGAEAVDMLQAMNTGHEGSLTTIHANSPRDALARLENMLGMGNTNPMPHRVARQQISAAISVVIQTLRLVDGRRKVTSIQEVTGMEGDTITLQEIFAFRQTGIGPGGEALGSFQPTGNRPHFASRLSAYGIELPDTLFDPRQPFH